MKTAGKTEKQIQRELAFKLKARMEVITSCGARIDLVTDKSIFEVKHIRHWRAALGQICSYGVFFPNHAKKLFLYGVIDKLRRFNIEYTCKKMGVEVLFDDSILLD